MMLLFNNFRFNGGGRDFGGRGGKSGSIGEGLRQPQWDLTRLLKFEKHFYQEHPLLASKSMVC